MAQGPLRQAHHLPVPRLDLRRSTGAWWRVPQKDSFKGLDTARHGLATLEHEIFLGFVFVRFAPGLPSVREMAAPYAHEIEAVPLRGAGAAWGACRCGRGA